MEEQEALNQSESSGSQKLIGEERVETKNIRFAVSIVFFLAGLCFASWASRIPDIKLKLHLSEAELGSILLALPAGSWTALPFSGRLVTHFGSRKMARVALLLYPLALIHISLVAEVWHLVVALYIFGLCGNMTNISVNTQGVMAESLLKRPLMASFHGGWSLAGFTGAGIGILMVANKFSPFVHYSVVATLIITSILITHRYLIPGKPAAGDKRPLFSLPNKGLMQLGLIAFCCMAAEGCMFDWSGVYFQKVVQAPPALVILGYAAFMGTMASGRFIGDYLVARFGAREILQASGVMIATGLAIAIAFPFLVPATIGFLIVGFGVSSVVPTVYSAAGKSSVTPGIALATVSSISFFGFLLGPPMIGYIAEALGLRYSFAVIALLGFCTSLIAGKAKLIPSRT